MTRLLRTLLAVVAVWGGAVAGAAPAFAHGSRATTTSVTPAIVGGSAATAGSFPWLAFITMGDGAADCSGTVISPDLILTAGHCADDTGAHHMYAPGGIEVTTGTVNWADTSSRQESRVIRTFPAPGYNPVTSDRDAAILQLATPTTAPAIALASDASLQTPGSAVVIAGWGLTDPANTDSPSQLYWAPTVVQGTGYCARGLTAFTASGQLCTLDGPDGGTSFCNGDSGGPVIANDFTDQAGVPTEIGIITESRNCSTTGPDYSARVDAISAWARQLIADYPAPAPSARASERSLGTLHFTVVHHAIHTMLTDRYGRAFAHARALRSACRRRSATRVTCRVAWSYRRRHYHGSVTIRLGMRHGRLVWVGHYAIH